MTFIIYTKSECTKCSKAKNLLQREEIVIINCDKLLKDDRESFINEMKRKTNLDKIIFPMIFIDDLFLGGYNELVNYIMFELNEDF